MLYVALSRVDSPNTVREDCKHTMHVYIVYTAKILLRWLFYLCAATVAVGIVGQLMVSASIHYGLQI